VNKPKEHLTVDSVTSAGKSLTDRWQSKADKLHADWMAKLKEMRQDYPDTPEPALMRMALQAVRLEAEIHDRQVERQWLQTNGSALAEHSEGVGERTGWNKRQQVIANSIHKDNHADREAVERWINENEAIHSNNQILIANLLIEMNLVSQKHDTIRKWAGEYLRSAGKTKRGRPSIKK
jgi:hypothetical protein